LQQVKKSQRKGKKLKKYEWVSFRELSDEMNIPERTLRHYHAKGMLPPAYRIGRHTRFRREDLTGWFKEGDSK
jgi:excisionase family DNA binding protein